jgi:uncharacterized membrane protein YhhN
MQKSRIFLYLFIFDLLVDLAAVYKGWAMIRIVTKPLLMILLLVFVSIRLETVTAEKRLLQSAIVGSLLGDIFLLLDNGSSIWFMLGLISFLVAHIFYIILFIRIRRKNQPRKKWNILVIILLAAYVGFFFYLLYPGLGSLKVPVIIYALVLAAMLGTAFHAFAITKQTYGMITVVGAFLFLVSDSLLAINKFYTSFFLSSVLIMFTYALAQLFIVLGVSKYIRSINNT